VKVLTSSLMNRYGLAAFTLVVLGVAALAYAVAWPVPVHSEEFYTTETITFGTNVVAGTTNDEQVDVEATLYLPKKARFPISAVIIVPSSSGVEEEREIYYAKELAKVGIAALVVDSFTARDLTDSLYDQSVIDSWDIENDAIAALQELAGDRRFKAHRIAIMGVSKGGTAAMNTAFAVRRRWMGVEDVSFAAHIAISPDCTWTNRRVDTTGAPMLFLLAELDNQTPAQACLSQVDRIKATGNRRVEAKVYAGANHAWEELGPQPEQDPKVENYSQCRVWIEDNGRMFSADTGELVPEDDWHGWAKKNCMTLGATCCGGTQETRDTATRDIIAFLRKNGF
jgi:dienelactone hydrolase